MCTHFYPSNMETAMNYLPKKGKKRNAKTIIRAESIAFLFKI